MIRTAECVSPMHPDKMCDRISDTLLDLHLEQDPNSRVAIETCGGMGEVYITGEVTSNAVVTRENIVKVVHDITTLMLLLISTHNRQRLLMELILVEQVTKEL